MLETNEAGDLNERLLLRSGALNRSREMGYWPRWLLGWDMGKENDCLVSFFFLFF